MLLRNVTMDTIKTLHREAMALADMAFAARSRGELETAHGLFREAFAKEEAAAIAAIELKVPEPTRSVLLRSAATLALNGNEARAAEKLVALALSGDPPDPIADELRDVYETVNLTRHLALRGIELSHDEFQVSLGGRAVGFGVALSREVLQRIENICRLVRRTVERKLGRPFQDVGRPEREVSEDYGLFLSVPRGASFAVSLKVAQPTGQQRIPGVGVESDVIEELMAGLAYIDANKERELMELINDGPYYRNFVNLAKAIAPDGEDISLVGFTSPKRTVALKTKRECITINPELSASVVSKEGERVKISGRLLFANSLKPSHPQIKLVDKAGHHHPLFVPEGMMTDIVKPLWESYVEITAKTVGGQLQLVEISPTKKPQS
jgi:hypothetical protein